MNHLTNLYKHKCIQLQEQIYRLTKILNEADAPGPTQFPSEPPLLPNDEFQVPKQPPPPSTNNPFGPKPSPEPKPEGYKNWTAYMDAWYEWYRGWKRWNSGERTPQPHPRGPSVWGDPNR
jgi:hypothetical protein